MATKAKRSNGSAKAKGSAHAAPQKKSASNAGAARTEWTAAEDKTLKTLIKQNTPTPVIGIKLKRAEASIRQHVSRLGLSLRPTIGLRTVEILTQHLQSSAHRGSTVP